ARWLPLTHKWLEWGTARAPTLFRRPTFPELYDVPEKLFILRIGGADLRSCFDNERLLTNHTTVVFVPWNGLGGVRNGSLKESDVYGGKGARQDERPCREELEEISRRFAAKYILAVLNSTTARNYLRANRRSNTDLYPDDWKQLPIPDVSSEEQAPIVA